MSETPFSSTHDGSSAPSDPLVGVQIGPFKVLRRLGEGGMGAVYLARQEKPARDVALKLVRATVISERMLRRFELEAEMLGRLHHPGIAQIYQAGTFSTPHGQQPFIAMEYIDGKPVDAYARLHGLTMAQRLDLAADICDAVQHAHQKGLVHRDLKPANILVTVDGQPKVLDFGLARAVESDVQMTAHTEAGDLVGTLGYMSPEQVGGEPGDLDTRSDVYALGVIVYELLTGRLPFEIGRKMVHEVVRTIREEEPKRLSTIDKIYRGDVETIVAKALEKEKSRRYQSASARAADLRRFLRDEPIAARPASALYQLVKFARRHRAVFASLVVIAATLVLGAGVATWQAVRASAAEHRAEEQAQLAGRREQEARVEQKRAEQEAVRASAAEQRAEEQAQLAGRREQEARVLQKRAEQAAAFAQEIFGGLNPYVANGHDTRLLKLVLQQTEARIATELRDLPEIEASIRITLGNAYTNLGLYDEADQQLDRAEAALTSFDKDHQQARQLLGARARLALRLGRYQDGTALLLERWQRNQRVLGDDDIDTVEARLSYADGLMRAGRHADAETETREVLDKAKHRFGEQSPTTVRAMSTLAVVLGYLAKYAEAETLSRKVLEIEKRDRGVESLKTWEAAANLAMLVDDQDRGAEAEVMNRETLAQLSRLLGAEHPQTLNVHNNLGCSLQHQRKFAEAEAVFRAVADARTRVLGPEHAETLGALANIANTLFLQGRIDDAEPLLRSVIDRRRKLVGVEHPTTLHSIKTLAEVLRARGDDIGAAKQMEEVAAAYRRTLKPEERALHISLYNWAATLQDARDWARAEVVFREVLELHQKYSGGKDEAFIASAMNGLAKILDNNGDPDGANEMFEQALAMRRRIHREGHVEIGYSLNDQGWVLLRREDWPAAERVLMAAVENAKKMQPPDAKVLAKEQGLLGGALVGIGKLAQAEPLLLAAEEVFAASVRAGDRELLRWLRLRLAALYEAKDRAEPGKDHAATAATWRQFADEVQAR